jgi:hypothetical protein
MQGPHTFLYLHTTRRLTSPYNYLPYPLYALTFTLVRSCFHVLHAIPILSLLYRVPAKMYYPSNIFLHTSYLLYQLPRRPQTQNSAPSCFRLWAHNGSNSNSQGSCPGGPLLGCSILHPLFFVWGQGSLPTLTNLHGDTSAYKRRRGTHGQSVGLP